VRSLGICLALLCLSTCAVAEERFPPPEFETGYTFPEPTAIPASEPDIIGYVDVAVLIAALSAASYLALKGRDRLGLFALMLFCLAYFGFGLFRIGQFTVGPLVIWGQRLGPYTVGPLDFGQVGCVCAIGSIQNVSLALFGSGYTIPLTVAAFFLVPLVFALLFGRTFCAAVCPLGAIQDLVVLRPGGIPSPLARAATRGGWLGGAFPEVPPVVEHVLGMVPYVYLAAAVVLAATDSAFIICRHDPFVSLLRLNGSVRMLLLGFGFLAVGVFIARPYCRFLCPYGAILRPLSKLSLTHLTITPDECIRCRLCEDACPFGAIQPPSEPLSPAERPRAKRRLALLIALTPLLAIAGGWLGGLTGPLLARTHPTVQTARRVRMEETGAVKGTSDLSDAFRKTGRTHQQLYADAQAAADQFTAKWTLVRLGGPEGSTRRIAFGWAHLMGALLGLIVAGKLIQLSVRRTRTDYEPDRAKCLSCGRCFTYCPREQDRLKKTSPEAPPVQL